MKYYYGLIDGDYGFIDENDSRLTDNFIELTEEQYNQLFADQSRGLDIVCYNGEVFTSEPDYYYVDNNNQWQRRTQEEVNEIRRQRREEYIAQLSLTKREVFLALYADKGVTPEQIEALISDPAALIEFRYAERYYRGNALIDLLGQSLGYTKQQLDTLFETGSFE